MISIKSIVLLSLLTVALQATQDNYLEAISLYNDKDYNKALPIIKEEANKGNKAAQYRLALMYENGLGLAKDDTQAMHWYKLASSQFSYIENNQEDGLKLIKNESPTDNIDRGNEYALAKLDTDTPETKKLLNSLTDGTFFGLQPYKDNFFLPVSYAKDKPKRVPSAFHVDDPNNPFTDSDLQYDKHTEVEFQISLKKQLTYDLFGMNEFISFAYTQKVWWQLYSDSGPFRETNYLPEIFMSIPSSQKIDQASGLKAVKFGFLHESNGQEGYRSRSWNRLYITGLWQWDNLFLATRAWYRLPEDEKPDGYYTGQLGPEYANEDGDDNPDIDKYLGYGDINIDYLYAKHQFGFLLRNNLRLNSDNKGAGQISWSYPFFDSDNTFWYAKFFYGYGESLIDYDEEVMKTSFGFSFSRGLF